MFARVGRALIRSGEFSDSSIPTSFGFAAALAAAAASAAAFTALVESLEVAAGATGGRGALSDSDFDPSAGGRSE